MAPGDDASSLDQQLKRGGSRSAPQLLSVESPLLSVGRRPPPLEAERAGDLKCLIKGGGGSRGAGGGASERTGHPLCTAQQCSGPGPLPQPPASAQPPLCVVKVTGVARI